MSPLFIFSAESKGISDTLMYFDEIIYELDFDINPYLCVPEQLLRLQHLDLLAATCWPVGSQHITNGGASTFCVLVSKS